MIKILGTRQLFSNLEKVYKNIENSQKHGLSAGADVLRDTAIAFVKTQTKDWNKGPVDDQITNPKNWNIEHIEENTVNLTCLPKHAPILEFGCILPSIVSWDYNDHRGWPVGKQQGSIKYFTSKIKLQPGIHFLENTMNSPDVRNNILNSIRIRMSQSLDIGL